MRHPCFAGISIGFLKVIDSSQLGHNQLAFLKSTNLTSEICP